MFQNLYFAIGEGLIFKPLPVADIPDGLVPLIPGAAGISPGKVRNVTGSQPLANDIAADTNDGPRVEGGVDSGAGIIAHQQTAFETGSNGRLPCRMPDGYFTGIVLQIGIGSAGPEVAPLADHGVAQITVMPLVGISEEHRILDLSSNYAIRP